jgi:hypothetical protein
MHMERLHPHRVFLKGNHSDLMLDALRHNSRIYGSSDLWWNQGSQQMAYSYLPKDATPYERAIRQSLDYIPQPHLDWLEGRPLYHEADHYIFVHAGLRPGIPLAEQSREDMLWIRESFLESDFDFPGQAGERRTPPGGRVAREVELDRHRHHAKRHGQADRCRVERDGARVLLPASLGDYGRLKAPQTIMCSPQSISSLTCSTMAYACSASPRTRQARKMEQLAPTEVGGHLCRGGS